MVIAGRGHTSVVSLLIHARASLTPTVGPNATVRNALVNAIESGHMETARLLLEHGHDINSVKITNDNSNNGYNWAPLTAAIDRGYDACVRMLLSYVGTTPSTTIDRHLIMTSRSTLLGGRPYTAMELAQLRATEGTRNSATILQLLLDDQQRHSSTPTIPSSSSNG
jgi:ankyrin repeat protein